MHKWVIKKSKEKRIKAHHPWIFTDDIITDIKTHTPGAIVELSDESNSFLALGYGNPHSQIAFRALSFEPTTMINEDFLVEKIIKSWKLRSRLGFQNSYRITFSENDGLSGLIIDLYSIVQEGKRGACYVAQISTAGMERLISMPDLFFKKLHTIALEEKLISTPWSHTAVIFKNESPFRKKEGLNIEKPKIIKNVDFFDFEKIEIQVSSIVDQSPLLFTVDLINGQKTGFFLDQTRNIEILIGFLKKKKNIQKLRVLDLCTYMGHWSAQIAYYCQKNAIACSVTAVDISEKALEFASQNINKQNPTELECVKADVLDDLRLDGEYDIVICDPPALIKSAKALPVGQHAYMKLNSSALMKLAPGGLMVTCSCSGLLSKEDFLNSIRRAFQRSKTEGWVIAEGGHAGDHPHSPHFPEGFYLKMFLISK